jgi:flagella basal body P-ring formation protein FlgA
MKRMLKHIAVFFLLTLAIFSPQHALSATDRDQEVRDAVTAFVTARTTGMGWDVRIRRITVSNPLRLPEGVLDYSVVSPQQWEGWGNVSVAVVARLKDRVVGNIPVRLEVEASVDTVVASRQIEYGSVIQDSDLILQKKEITQSSHLAARNINEIAGKIAKRTLIANQPVSSDQVEKIPLIKSGQMVTIVAENEVLKITVSGKARSSGAEGDTIRVQNLSSQKEIPARVISASTVQVVF